MRRVFAESVAGRGVKQIADGLNFDGIGGHRWWASSIARTLRREVYAGGSREYLGIAVPFPPIVPKQQWDKAQAARHRRIRVKRGRQPRVVYMLSHLAECVECGFRFIARTKNRSDRAPIRYYLCGGQPDGSRCRATRYIRAEKLDEAVWAEIEGLLMSPELLRAAIQSAKAPDDMEADIAQLRRDISSVDREIDTLTKLFMTNRIEQAPL